MKTLASGDATPEEGDTVTFDITVTNNGPGDATNVNLTDLLPPGLTATALNGAITQGTYDATTGLWTIGSLANGASATLTLEGTVDSGQEGTTITNVTTAAIGDQIDPTTVGDDLDESVAVELPVIQLTTADLVTVKTLASGDPTPEEGDTVTFQIEVTNNGLSLATNVSLTDLLPEGLTATANNGNVTQGTYDPVTGLFTIGTLGVGATATLTLEGTVNVGQSGNTITNITTAATGDQVDPTTSGDDLQEEVVVDVTGTFEEQDIAEEDGTTGNPGSFFGNGGGGSAPRLSGIGGPGAIFSSAALRSGNTTNPLSLDSSFGGGGGFSGEGFGMFGNDDGCCDPCGDACGTPEVIQPESFAVEPGCDVCDSATPIQAPIVDNGVIITSETQHGLPNGLSPIMIDGEIVEDEKTGNGDNGFIEAVDTLEDVSESEPKTNHELLRKGPSFLKALQNWILYPPNVNS